MSVVIRITGLRSGMPTPLEGKFVKSYDPDGGGGRGALAVSERFDGALRFKDTVAAFEAVRAQSTVKPDGDDGQPNRPLTVYKIELVPVK